MTQDGVQVTVDGGSDELVRLSQWLRSEDELRGRVRLAARPAEDSAMGGAFEFITVAVSSGGAVTVLVKSLFSWLSLRDKPTTMKVRFTRSNGDTAEVELDGGQDHRAVLAKLMALFD
jgi:hypothetical protein